MSRLSTEFTELQELIEKYDKEAYTEGFEESEGLKLSVYEARFMPVSDLNMRKKAFNQVHEGDKN